ncbi:hypothetical protein [Actinoplanes philippinensis]|uniref:hypothetical protein n=1 Tax=Actinoplanes philippinensis TaxID=35752 RepID=UPI0033F15958
MIAAGVLVVAVPAGIVAVSMLPAAAAATTPVAGGVYTLASGASGNACRVLPSSAGRGSGSLV